MGIIFALLPLSILLSLVFLVGYLWAVRSRQFEDLETPALRILLDDDDGPAPATLAQSHTKAKELNSQ